MEGSQGEEQVRLGVEAVSANNAQGAVVTLDNARLHRELALGNLFVELRQLVKLGVELAKQEIASQVGR